MTDDEWTSELKEAFASRRRNPTEAVARLQAMARRAARAERHSIGRRHEADALMAAAITLSEAQRPLEAARLFRRAARVHESALRYHGHGLTFALANTALELFKAGIAEPAAKAGAEALRLFGQFPDPSASHEELVRRLRAHLQEKAMRSRRKGAG